MGEEEGSGGGGGVSISLKSRVRSLQWVFTSLS